MCGIVGIYNKNKFPTEDRISFMCDTLSHRGPDDKGTYINQSIALGQRRLSIIDLSPAGHQPMSSADGEITLVFNGELYNHLDIRDEMSAFNFQYKGSSDTETLINAYKVWGYDAFKKLNGIFGIAIHDKTKNTLVIARDRFGVKPLYYYNDHDSLFLGSEIKAILSQGIKPVLNYESLHEFMYYGYATKEKTMYKGIKKLLPGYILEVNCLTGEIVKNEPFWKHEDMLPENFDIGEQEAINSTKSLLENAVKRQLISDVPVGVFLSGGIDSSAVTAFASKHYGGKLNSFSAGFDFNDGHDELPMAKKLAHQYGTDHHEIYIEGNNMKDTIIKMVHHHDEPFSDAANIPLFLMTQMVKDTCKVILQGDGGDEIFAGYPRYHILEKSNLYKYGILGANLIKPVLPKSIKNRVERFYPVFAEKDNGRMLAKMLTVESEEQDPRNVFNKSFSGKMNNYNPFSFYEELNKRFSNLTGLPQKMLWIDTLIILPDQFLEKVDKSTMASGVEVRVPFLDNELTAFAMSLPGAMKVKNGVKKYLLKKALSGIVPDEVLYGPKKGFGVPYSNWIKGPLFEFMLSRIKSPYVQQLGILDYPHIDRLISEHKNNITDHGFILWKLLNLCIWIEDYKIELQ